MIKILLVDDDETIRFATSELLKGRGYEVVEAENGFEAIKRIEEHSFDVVLLDIFMPERDGFETIGEIRRNNPDLKVIAMSGYSEHSFNPLAHVQSLGADAALTKPFSAEIMIKTIDQLFTTDR